MGHWLMSRDQYVAVGVEIGGGQASVALVDQWGVVRRRCQAKTLRGRPATATLEPYIKAIDNLLTEARAAGWLVAGIGVSIPGSIHPETQRPYQISMLPSLNNFPLREFLEARYGLPCVIHTDVEAGILGEWQFGAGQDCPRLLYLTVNAVVGAALIIDGQLVHAPQRYTGHICHLPIAPGGPRCSCGKRGCINTLITLDAMQKMVQRALRRGDETSLVQRFQNHEYFSPQLLAEEARQGDGVAQQVYHEVSRWLGAAARKYIDVFEPDMLVVGGSVLHAGNELLLSPLRSALSSPGDYVSNGVNGSRGGTSVCNLVQVVPASLGNDEVLVGVVAPLFA